MSNPFDPPEEATDAAGAPDPFRQADVRLTPQMLGYLQEMRPWQLGLGVLSLVVAALLILGGLAVAAVGVVAGELDALPLALIYPVGGLVYAIPGWYLLRSAHALGRARSDAEDRLFLLEESLRNQRSLWRFLGIASLLGAGVLLVLGAALCGVALIGSR